jgi:hypothetical protein
MTQNADWDGEVSSGQTGTAKNHMYTLSVIENVLVFTAYSCSHKTINVNKLSHVSILSTLSLHFRS